MNLKCRFFALAIWGIFLPLVFTGCPLPAGLDETGPDSGLSARETPEDEDEDEDGGEENPGGDEETPEDEDEDGGEDSPGEEENPDGDEEAPEDEDEDGGEENSGGDEETPEGGEPGFLSWDITYPEEKVWAAALTVSRKISEDAVPYTQVDIRGTGSQKISLPPGTYQIEFRLLSHNAEEVSTELVRVYPGLETKSGPVNISEAAFPAPQEFSSTGDLKAYLAGLPENTAANPHPVKISGVDLSSTAKTGETLKTLYEAIAQRFVTLDLRGAAGASLAAASSASLDNRANIVSLVLPESITEIGSNGFSGYTALKFTALPRVISLDTSAFKNCGRLEAVFAPELRTIAEAGSNTTGAFTGCTALNALYVPRLETLGKYGLYGCTGLIEGAFPNLRTLGRLAFKRCAALKGLSLPSAARIDAGCFEEAPALSYLVFGAEPPELAAGVFEKNAGFLKTGVIYVPPDSVEAYNNTGLPNWSGLKELLRALPEPASP
jgi:hypothetical protein